MLFLVLASLACVKTAECDAHVNCDEGLVCFQRTCLAPCERDAQCAESETCSTCEIPGDSVGHCEGVAGGACTAGGD